MGEPMVNRRGREYLENVEPQSGRPLALGGVIRMILRIHLTSQVRN